MVQTLGVVLDFAESGSIKTKEDLFAIYDANYYFDDNFYGFALGRVKTDGLAETVGTVKTDAFVDVGPVTASSTRWTSAGVCRRASGSAA